MGQSTNENNRKDDCGDNEYGNEEATSSKAVFNDPIRNERHVIELKTLEFNSADDVRQAVKAIILDKMPHLDREMDNCSLDETDMNANYNLTRNVHQGTENTNGDKNHTWKDLKRCNQSTNENNRKVNCGDSENGNIEATSTSSKVVLNYPVRSSRHLIALKTLEFNSADDVRQAVKAVISGEISHLNEEANICSASHDYIHNKHNLGIYANQQGDCEDGKENNHKGRNSDLNRTEPFVTKKNRIKQATKRLGRSLKAKPSKRYKKSTVNGFYFIYYPKNSSDDDSIFSV